MELPVAKESYQPSADALVRAIKRAGTVYARPVAQEATLGCGIALASPHRPGDPAVNLVSDFNPGDGQGRDVAAALSEIDAHFAEAGARCLRLRLAGSDWPTAAAGPLESAGYRLTPRTVRLLRHYRPPPAATSYVQIIPARASYAQLRPLFTRMAADLRQSDGWADTQVDVLDEARLELFLARVQGQAVGVAGVLSLGQMGVIYPAWVDPEHRRRGIGGALLRHVMEHCQRATFEQVLLDLPADHADHAAHAAHASEGWCDRLGFVPVATFADYQRT